MEAPIEVQRLIKAIKERLLECDLEYWKCAESCEIDAVCSALLDVEKYYGLPHCLERD